MLMLKTWFKMSGCVASTRQSCRYDWGALWRNYVWKKPVWFIRLTFTPFMTEDDII